MDYTLIRSRRKTIAIQITPQAEVIVRCPMKMAQEDILRFVEQKQHWIEKHLSACTPIQPLSSQELRDLAAQAKADLSQRVAHFAPLVGVGCGRSTIRSQRTRWGSCRGKGNLNFNCLLMLAPPEIRDYVVVHELCHRLHMDHSPAFWAAVRQILPDYAVRRAWLKTNGRHLIARLPRA